MYPYLNLRYLWLFNPWSFAAERFVTILTDFRPPSCSKKRPRYAMLHFIVKCYQCLLYLK